MVSDAGLGVVKPCAWWDRLAERSRFSAQETSYAVGLSQFAGLNNLCPIYVLGRLVV